MKPLLTLLLLAGALTACAVRDARYQPHEIALTRSLLPPDVGPQSKGIHALPPRGDDGVMCCAVDNHAVLRVRNDLHTPRALVVGLYVPSARRSDASGLVSYNVAITGTNAKWTIRPKRGGFLVKRLMLHGVRIRTLGSEVTVQLDVLASTGSLEQHAGTVLTSVYFE